MVSRTRNRSGYALLGVLWICAGVGALSAAISAAAREAIASSRNRVALTRASWQAEACLALARTVVTERLREAPPLGFESGRAIWNRVDMILGTALSETRSGCEVSASAVGSRIDVNAMDEAVLARLLTHLGIAADTADSMAALLVAKRPFLDMQEVMLLLRPDSSPPLANLFGVEPGPISVNHVPPAVLASLPGFTRELVDRVMENRRRGVFVRAFQELSAGLTSAARDTLAAASARLPGIVVLEPAGWLLTVHQSTGNPPVTVVIEIRIARFGERVGAVRRRSWTG